MPTFDDAGNSEYPVFRPDLNGQCVKVPGGSDVWLVFGGERHKITSPEVFRSLFVEGRAILEVYEADTIALGDDLGPGSGLSKAEGSDAIYLITSSGVGLPTRHPLRDMEQFHRFGLDPAHVRHVGATELDHLQFGADLDGDGLRGSHHRVATALTGLDPLLVGQWQDEAARLTDTPSTGRELPEAPTLESLQLELYHLRSRYARAVAYADQLMERLRIERRRGEEATSLAETLRLDLEDANVATVYWRQRTEPLNRDLPAITAQARNDR